MTREEKLLKHIKEYLDSGMWKYEGCALGKEDLEIIIKALEQEPKKDEVILSNKEYREIISREYESGYDKGYCDALKQEPCEEREKGECPYYAG